jgi:hypothetical protein
LFFAWGGDKYFKPIDVIVSERRSITKRKRRGKRQSGFVGGSGSGSGSRSLSGSDSGQPLRIRVRVRVRVTITVRFRVRLAA